MNKAFDKAEEGVVSIFKKKEQTGQNDESSEAATGNAGEKEAAGEVNREVSQATGQANEQVSRVTLDKQKPELVWAKYDFVPGDKVFFEDNHENEQNGEFRHDGILFTAGVSKMPCLTITRSSISDQVMHISYLT